MYRTTIHLTVLSENPIPETAEVEDILREAEQGDFVLGSTEMSQEELTPKAMADALYAAGSEPGFFMLDDQGHPEGAN